MSKESERYVSYLLRLWQSNEADGPVWRASLEHTRSGQRFGFANLESLFAFLQTLSQSPGDAESTVELPDLP